jgi:phage terminase large subunit
MVRQLINFDRLIISKKCTDTLQEITTYSYPDPKALPVGADADAPIKEFDDLCDSMRYGIYLYETRYGARFRR